jgi:beta-fructofuranosidase
MQHSDSSGHRSLVPAYRFSTDLAAQEAELAANPLLARFAESRERLDADPHRPRYHFVSPEHRLNDPNGLCYWQGRWHLFYQGYPPEDPRQHWGHAVSDDLVHWRDLPYAIYPDPERCCFSGTTLVEADRVIAIYHGTEVGTMVAVSSDPLLLNWEKLTGRPVIPFPAPGKPPVPYAIFDPCLWREEGVYYALTGGMRPAGPAGKRVRANFLHRSTDLVHWEYLHPFVEDDHYSLVGDDGACPYFLPLGERHILLHFSHQSGGKYLLGDYDRARDRFVVTDGRSFNHGPMANGGVHAPSAAPIPDGSGDLAAIFNMNPGKPTDGWDQIMSLPLRLTHRGGDSVGIAPFEAVESLAYDRRTVGPMTLEANREIVFDELAGNSIVLHAVIDAGEGEGTVPVVELDVLRSPDGEERTRILCFRDRGNRDRSREEVRAPASVVSIDLSCASTDATVRPRPPETFEIGLEAGEPFDLTVFVDRSIVEVFVNGIAWGAVRVYPSRPDSSGVSLIARGRDASLVAFEGAKMRSIYRE